MKPQLKGKHARRAAFQAMVGKKPQPALPDVPPVPGAANLPIPGSPSALLKRQIMLPAQPVGGGSLAQLLMG